MNEVNTIGNGNTLFFIDYLGLYFRASREVVNDALLEFCRQCDTEGMSVGEFIQSVHRAS